MHYSENEIKNACDEIAKMVSTKNYGFAIDICKKYPDCEKIQLLLINIYYMLNKQSKIIEVASRFPQNINMIAYLAAEYTRENRINDAILIFEKYPNEVAIQEVNARYLHKSKQYDKVEKLALQFPDSTIIQYNYVLGLMREKKYDEVLQIVKREKFYNVPFIQLVYINVLEIKKNYEEVDTIAKRFPEYEPMQSNYINLLRREYRFEEAKKIAFRYQDSISIMGQLMIMYMNEGDFKSAKELAKNNPDNCQIQYQICRLSLAGNDYENIKKIATRSKMLRSEEIQKLYIVSLLQQNKITEAKEVAYRYPKSSLIQFELYKILISEKEFERAEKVFKRFAKEQKFLDLKASIIAYYEQPNQEEIDHKETIDYNDIMNEIRNKIHGKVVNYDDIELLKSIQNNISSKTYNLILAAIYERMGQKSNAIKILKDLPERDGKINEIINGLKCKKSMYYDLGKWDAVIGWFTEKSMNQVPFVEPVIKKKENNIPINIAPQEKQVNIVKTEEKRVITEKPKININQQIQNSSNELIKTEYQKSKPKNKTVKKEKKISENNQINNTIYACMNEEYKKAIYKVKLDLYSKMKIYGKGKKILSIYDNLEKSLLASTTNEKALDNILIILISEGFDTLVERDYPEKYELFSELIDEANAKKVR